METQQVTPYLRDCNNIIFVTIVSNRPRFTTNTTRFQKKLKKTDHENEKKSGNKSCFNKIHRLARKKKKKKRISSRSNEKDLIDLRAHSRWNLSDIDPFLPPIYLSISPLIYPLIEVHLGGGNLANPTRKEGKKEGKKEEEPA